MLERTEGSSNTITTPFMKFTDLERNAIMSAGYSRFSVLQMTYRCFSCFSSFNFKISYEVGYYSHYYSHFTDIETRDESTVSRIQSPAVLL